MKESTGMKVSVDFNCLQENKLSADLYVLLYCKHNGLVVPEYVGKKLFRDEDALKYLQAKEFIKITVENEFSLRQKAINLFQIDSPTTKWLEFLGEFPLKVPGRNGSARVLKVANPDSKGNVKIKKKYLALIKTVSHDRIIKALQAEIDMRKKSNELQYMHGMDTWLNQADYDKYDHLIKEGGINNSSNKYWK